MFSRSYKFTGVPKKKITKNSKFIVDTPNYRKKFKKNMCFKKNTKTLKNHKYLEKMIKIIKDIKTTTWYATQCGES